MLATSYWVNVDPTTTDFRTRRRPIELIRFFEAFVPICERIFDSIPEVFSGADSGAS